MTPKQVRKLWAKALRSGEYIQGNGQLRRRATKATNDQPSFCCLGVLADLAVKEGIIRGFNGNCGHIVDEDGPSYPRYPKVAQWAGLSKSEEYNLILLNDDEEADFKRIAWEVERPTEAELEAELERMS